MKTFKTRHQFYLPDDLSAKLDALTSSPGTSKTQILTDALNAWLDRKGAQELDQRFGPRLDRQNRTAERLERKVDVLTEMLGVFILHQLTLVAHQPVDSDTARLAASSNCCAACRSPSALMILARLSRSASACGRSRGSWFR